MPLVDLGRGQGFGIPASGRLIKEPGGRRHRDARRRLAEERELEKLAEGAPARDAPRFGRALAREPSELRRPVRGMQMTARASVERVVVECPAEQLRVAGAPRVAP